MNAEMTIWRRVWPPICWEEMKVLYCTVILFRLFNPFEGDTGTINPFNPLSSR